jgi:Uma2 family endonuclease
MEESLMETLGLEETYTLVYEDTETEIYAHTLYYEVPKIDYDKFVTEDETPVDNLFSETQQRIYIDPLYASQWTDRDFMACSNVAIYYKPKVAPIVPDMFLSFDVTKPKEWHDKKNKCYFLWRMKKAPELVIEIVSNKEGNENTTKFNIYADMGVLYYIIHDPYKELYEQELNVFQLVNGVYVPYEADDNHYMPEITLGLRLWEGIFENASALCFVQEQKALPKKNNAPKKPRSVQSRQDYLQNKKHNALTKQMNALRRQDCSQNKKRNAQNKKRNAPKKPKPKLKKRLKK